MAKLSVLEHHKDFLSTQLRILFTTSQRVKPRYATLAMGISKQNQEPQSLFCCIKICLQCGVLGNETTTNRCICTLSSARFICL